MLVYDFCSIGYEGPIFHKIGSARGVNYSKLGLLEGTIQGKHPLRQR